MHVLQALAYCIYPRTKRRDQHVVIVGIITSVLTFDEVMNDARVLSLAEFQTDPTRILVMAARCNWLALVSS